MSRELIIQKMEQNIREKLSYIPNILPDMTVEQVGTPLVVDSAMASDTFNTAYGGVVTETEATDV